MSARQAKKTHFRLSTADARRAAGPRKAQADMVFAARQGDAQALRLALDRGADPAVWVDGQTPLMLVCARRDAADCVRLLLPKSDPLAATNSGHDALMAAASAGAAESVALLLPLSQPLRANSCGQTALALAVLHGEISAFRLLLPRSDPRQANTHGITPLMAAACVGALDFVIPLLNGSDLLACDEKGRDALAHAVFGDHARYLADDAPACAQAIAEKAPLSRLLARDAEGLTIIELARSGLGVFGPRMDEKIDEIVDNLRQTIARKEREALLSSASRSAAPLAQAAAPIVARRL